MNSTNRLNTFSEGKPILAPGWVKGLYQVCGESEKHGVAGGAAHHAQHRQPHVRQGLRRESGVVKIQIQELWRERQGEYQGLTCRSRCTTCGTLPWRAPTSIVPTSRSPYKKYNCFFFFQFPVLKRVLPTALTNSNVVLQSWVSIKCLFSIGPAPAYL